MDLPMAAIPQKYDISITAAREMDAADPLAQYRNEFIISDLDLIYVDGNSLGRLPRRTIPFMKNLIENEWGAGLVRGWNSGWYEAPCRLGDKIGKLVGAAPGQVLIADSTSVDLFKLVMGALAMRPERTAILSDTMNFPSDIYILQGCARILGGRHRLSLVGSQDGIQPDLTELFQLIEQKPAVVVLSHVAFKSGYLYDMRAVTERIHQAGSLVLWDLSHSVGVVPIQLDTWGVDLAVGCTYKYLNGGPGSPAFLYIRRDLQSELLSPIWGWFGQNHPFRFDLDYVPGQGVNHFLAGTPPVLSMLAVEPAVDLLLEVGIEKIREKSERLTSYAVSLVDTLLAPLGFSLGSPRLAVQRGSHISLRHLEGYRINRALIEEMDVLPDFREPDNIRLGFAPLYNSFEDVWQAVERIRRVIEQGRYRNYSNDRQVVT